MPLAHRIGVEPELLGEHRGLHHALEPLVHADDLPGHRVRHVRTMSRI
jgi:hypothetical protein